MMDLVQGDVTARARTPRLEETDDLLVLPRDGKPKTVFVKAMDSGVAGFRSEETQPYHTQGMKWQPADQHDLFITFVFVEGIDKLEPGTDVPTISLSERFQNHNQQMGSAPGPTKQEQEYHFTVKFLAGFGTRHDPKIVITPL